MNDVCPFCQHPTPPEQLFEANWLSAEMLTDLAEQQHRRYSVARKSGRPGRAGTHATTGSGMEP
jgi:hypothetical protein